MMTPSRRRSSRSLRNQKNILRSLPTACAVAVCLALFLAGTSLLLLTRSYFHHPSSSSTTPFNLFFFGKNTSHEHHGADPPQHRIAILLPFAASVSQHNNNKPAAPPLSYWLTFCTGAAAAASVADFWIIHTGIFNDTGGAILAPQEACPPNVIFVNLQSHHALAERLLRVLDRWPEHEWSIPKDDLVSYLASYLQARPYALVEFKPALGHIFQDYLRSNDDNTPAYTHWGYSDLDVLFGDLGRWITPDEWNDYDIVTYTFGDQQRLYLRGQFTFHRIDAMNVVNQLWRPCTYLSRIDERFARLLSQKDTYRPESAEGCYSAAIMDRDDIAVKFAVKAWTDIYNDDTAYSHGILWAQSSSSLSSSTKKAVLYKVHPEFMSDAAQVSNLPADWFERDAVYANLEQPLQYETGERIPLDLEQVFLENNASAKNPGAAAAATTANCMYWAHSKYQTKLCLRPESGVTRDDTVIWSHGTLYKQRYVNTAMAVSKAVATAPLFHFQEWKRSYRFEQLATMHLNSLVKRFALVPEGAIPLIDGGVEGGGGGRLGKRKQQQHAVASSPLGLANLKDWKSVEKNLNGLVGEDRSQLPGNHYCLISGVDAYGQRSECQSAVSWQSNATTFILAGAPGWSRAQINTDVTLVVTLPITAAQAQSPRALHRVMDHLLVTLNRWHGQPSIVIMAIAGATQTTLDLLSEKLNPKTKVLLQSSLIAAVTLPDDTTVDAAVADEDAHDYTVSRKALWNMAVDAVPTRWYLTGLEVERGLSISVDAAFLAHRAAAAHQSLRANVFWMPQWALESSRNDNSNQDGEAAAVQNEVQETLGHLQQARQEHKLKILAAFDPTCDEDDIPGGDHRLGSLAEKIWWTESQFLLKADETNVDGRVARRVASAQELEQAVLSLGLRSSSTNTDNEDDENPPGSTDLDESPFLLMDNHGPHPGMRTNELVRQVEALGGPRCWNGLQLQQLVLLGYSLNVLAGAFALSSESSRKAASAGIEVPVNRCRACTMFPNEHYDVVSRVAQTEITRAAKSSILWAEEGR